MREDFAHAREQLNSIGILNICSDFYLQPKRRGNNYFVKSPSSIDKTWSLALYPGSNRFCDFSNSSKSGDCIGFLAYIRNCNQWESLQILSDYYGLDDREQDRQEIRRKIQQQQEQERKKRQRKQAFKAALSACIDDLKRWESIYKAVLKNGLYEPFGDMWCYTVNELRRANYHLNILCASDQTEYRVMKPNSERIPSDYFQWLLDCLSVLKDCEAFQATESELKEIRAQRDYELTRKPGAEKRCCDIEW